MRKKVRENLNRAKREADSANFKRYQSEETKDETAEVKDEA